MDLIRISVRYFVMQGTNPEDIVESNIRYSEVIWEIDSNEAALVLVDLWNKHVIRSHMERIVEIVDDKISSAMQIARKAGITVIHAPSGTIAKKYPQWTRYAGDEELNPPRWQPPSWPPEDFRNKTEKYAQYAHRFYSEDISKFAREYYKDQEIPEIVKPEPEDFVIATGRQLQRLLEHRKILHLFYAGFAANDCLIHKDYGVRAMGERGYNIILLRDCTTAIESSYTLKNSKATELIVQYIELRYSSTTSEDFIKACNAAK